MDRDAVDSAHLDFCTIRTKRKAAFGRRESCKNWIALVRLGRVVARSLCPEKLVEPVRYEFTTLNEKRLIVCHNEEFGCERDGLSLKRLSAMVRNKAKFAMSSASRDVKLLFSWALGKI
jgi:hypothetical protein